MQKNTVDIDRRELVKTIGAFTGGGIVLGGMAIPFLKNALADSSLEIEILNTRTNIHSRHSGGGLETYVRYNGKVYHIVEQLCEKKRSPQEFLEETSRHYDPYLSADQIRNSDASKLFQMIYDKALRVPENQITKGNIAASKQLEAVTPGNYHVPILTSYKSLDNIPKSYLKPIRNNEVIMHAA